LPVILYECKNWWFTLRKKNKLRVFENRVLRKTFGSKRNKATEGLQKMAQWGVSRDQLLNKYHSSDQMKESGIRGRVARKREGRGEEYIELWWKNRKESCHLENLQVGGRIILNCIFKKWHKNT
jgi:hypothetical protein